MEFEALPKTMEALEILSNWDKMSEEQAKAFEDKYYLAWVSSNFPKPLEQMAFYVRMNLKHAAAITHVYPDNNASGLERAKRIYHTLVHMLSYSLLCDMNDAANLDEAMKSPCYQLMETIKSNLDGQLVHLKDKFEKFLFGEKTFEEKTNRLCEILVDDAFFPIIHIERLKFEDEYTLGYELEKKFEADFFDKLIADCNIDTSLRTNKTLSDLVNLAVQFDMSREMLMGHVGGPLEDAYVVRAMQSLTAYFNQMTPEKWNALQNDEETLSADMKSFIKEFHKDEINSRESEKKQKQRERELRKKAEKKRKKK